MEKTRKKNQDVKEINILLIGETGCGKSTFINSFVNYMSYQDIDTAKRNPPIILIPSSYNMVDKYTKNHFIQIGKKDDKNEYLEVGESATQYVKPYVFNFEKGMKIRLIDTPGLGDTRGIAQDKKNIENIFSHIGEYSLLHGICFFIKPTVTRLTPSFEYCIKQILCQFHKKASQNMLFIFTNTRGTNYTPGDSLLCVKKLIEGIEKDNKVKIPFENNKFCIDNEGFKYLAAMKENIQFDSSVKEGAKESWTVSYKECWRLLKYIMGDDSQKGLKPHEVKYTTSINEARLAVDKLTKPLADISNMIDANIRALERHKLNLTQNYQSLEELKAKLYMPVVGVKKTQLKQPVTVCTDAKCSEIIQVPGTDKNVWLYKQKCHNPCYLTNIPKEIIGSPGLLQCAAMFGTEHCTRCSCSFRVHMHIYYEVELKSEKIIDENVKESITTKSAALEEVFKLLGNINTQQTEFQAEHQEIIETAATFAYFLKQNAITPYNDAYKSYIEYLIERELYLKDNADEKTVKHLKTMLAEYEEKKAVFEKTYQEGNNKEISPKDIIAKKEALFKLKHTGKEIRDLFVCQNKMWEKEYRNMEYIHKNPIKKPDLKSERIDKNKNKAPISVKSKEFRQKYPPISNLTLRPGNPEIFSGPSYSSPSTFHFNQPNYNYNPQRLQPLGYNENVIFSVSLNRPQNIPSGYVNPINLNPEPNYSSPPPPYHSIGNYPESYNSPSTSGSHLYRGRGSHLPRGGRPHFHRGRGSQNHSRRATSVEPKLRKSSFSSTD